MNWLLDNLPPGFAEAILWVAFALLLLFVFLAIVRLLGRLRGGTFVLGGRNRRTRLAVMDATAIDSRRRLVLVRRDDVEHLILIGGPTDVVVEQDIHLVPKSARNTEPRSAPEPAAAPAIAPRPSTPSSYTPSRPIPPPAPAPVRPPAATPPPPAPIPRAVTPVPAPVVETAHRQETSAPNRTAVVSPTAAKPEVQPSDVDDNLLADLDLELNVEPVAPPVKLSPNDEMNRLLGELTKRK